jgi:hypothetical protein
MPEIFGRTYTRSQITAYAGSLLQAAGVRIMELGEGLEAGVRIADVRTGSGLRFQINLDRGMDISLAEYKGIPLAFRSANGDVHPHRFEPQGHGWLRGFPGGLMTGCGMTYLGSPCTDEGEALGQHGRLSNTPASAVCHTHRWEGDECLITVAGEVRETTPFKENLLLRRTVELRLGQSVITIRDLVRNEGSEPVPLMMLYHVNAGWPLVSDGARLHLHALRTEPRDADARAGIDEAGVFSAPVAGYREQVFYHDLQADEEGYACAMLANAGRTLGMYVRYRQEDLPRFIEWKMMGQGFYAVGMEPANCRVEGRAKERAAGTLQFLAPEEERQFLVQIGVIEGEEGLTQFIKRNGLQ